MRQAGVRLQREILHEVLILPWFELFNCYFYFFFTSILFYVRKAVGRSEMEDEAMLENVLFRECLRGIGTPDVTVAVQ